MLFESVGRGDVCVLNLYRVSEGRNIFMCLFYCLCIYVFISVSGKLCSELISCFESS